MIVVRQKCKIAMYDCIYRQPTNSYCKRFKLQGYFKLNDKIIYLHFN